VKTEKQRKVYQWPGGIDMRKSRKGLTRFVDERVGIEVLYNGDIFVFCNRNKDLTKILWWGQNGFELYEKQLADENFTWPDENSGIFEIMDEENTQIFFSNFNTKWQD
jgi:transposase